MEREGEGEWKEGKRAASEERKQGDGARRKINSRRKGKQPGTRKIKRKEHVCGDGNT